MIMTVRLFSVWLHNIQVTICWVWVLFFFSLGGERPSFTILYPKIYFKSALYCCLNSSVNVLSSLRVQISAGDYFCCREESKNSTVRIFFFAFETTIESLLFYRLCTTIQESGLSPAHFQ